MPVVAPFKGIRYNRRKVGLLSRVVTPPYDVISPAGQRSYYRRHPHNFIRVVFGRERATDDARHNRYLRARATLGRWMERGILQPDPKPSFYPYEQEYRLAGKTHCRRGIIALVHLGASRIRPHEETREAPLQDRLLLLKSVRASLSPIFGLIPDEGRSYHRLTLRLCRGRPVATARLDGVRHRLWRVSDTETIRVIRRCLRSRDLVIADGHHRYEAARRFCEQMQRENPKARDGPYQYAMFYLAAAGKREPGLFPTREAVRWILGRRRSPAVRVRRPRVAEVLDHARRGVLMPGKTTYFYPKPLAGLVEYKFEL